MRYFLAKKKLHMLQYKKGDIDLENGFLKMLQTLSTSASSVNSSTFEDSSRKRTAGAASWTMDDSAAGSNDDSDQGYAGREGGERASRRSGFGAEGARDGNYFQR